LNAALFAVADDAHGSLAELDDTFLLEFLNCLDQPIEYEYGLDCSAKPHECRGKDRFRLSWSSFPSSVTCPMTTHKVTSSDHFKGLLSEDLQRVSLLYFWAPWAAPCKQMSEVVAELSRKYQELLALEIEAEEQSEITESFDIESVPTFIILRGHTFLERIKGADAPALTEAIAKHLRSSDSTTPLSHSDKSPAPPPAAEKTETPDDLEKRMRGLMKQSKVVLFMKGSPSAPRCGFSRKICSLLDDENIDYSHFDILTDESVRQGLKKLNDWPTFPQLIVNGELVGGLDIAKEMVESGELKEIVSSA